jgi:hypothetical protein
MSLNEFESWADTVRAALAELATQQSEYPLGTNQLRAPSRQSSKLPAELQPLYAVCDGMSLPDVHIGYFIDPAQRVMSASERGEPTRVEGKQSVEVQVFGSDGGGGRFALGTAEGAVYYLPSSGAVRNGAFVEDDIVRARRIAGSVVEFISRLEDDIRAFVHGSADHVYLDKGIGNSP